MKAYVAIAIMLAVAVFAVADAHAATDKVPPKDQPNFHAKITKQKIDGRSLDIVEFQCKLAR